MDPFEEAIASVRLDSETIDVGPVTVSEVVRRPDPRLAQSWCQEGVAHDHRACGLLWDSTSASDREEADRWTARRDTGTNNPKDTNAFARVGMICGRFRDMNPTDTIAAVATPDGGVDRLTYGDLTDLLSLAFDAGDRLQRIGAWHSRETGPGGMVGDCCTECGNPSPCDTRKMADGTYVDSD